MHYVIVSTDRLGSRNILLKVLSEKQMSQQVFNFVKFYFTIKECEQEQEIENLPYEIEIYDVWDKDTTYLPLGIEPDFRLNFKTICSVINLYKSEKNVDNVDVEAFVDFFMEWRKCY